MSDLDYRRTALLLITPDAVRRHLSAEVLRRLDVAGFRVAGHRLWHTAPGDLDAFHRRNAPVARDPALYRLIEDLFALGPLIALAVQEGTGHPPYGVHRRLAELKGRGDPAYAAPGSIRKDLRSINTVLNIVHSSDDAEDTAREAVPFLEGGHGPLETGESALRRSLYLAEHGHPAETRLFEDVLAGVRTRVLAAVWGRIQPARRALAESRPAFRDAALLGGPEGSELLTAVLPAGHRLGGIVDPPPPGGECPADRRELELDALAELGVVLDPWERLVLATSRYYPPLPDSRAAGAPPGGAAVLAAPGEAVPG
ncbi:nucleoside-diphosphate kinase [Streptomyces canarius]